MDRMTGQYHQLVKTLVNLGFISLFLSLGACDSDSSNLASAGPVDTTAPTFNGVASVGAAGGTRLLISWAAASDATSNANAIFYRIYSATGNAANIDFATPIATTATGVLSHTLSELSVSTNYFVVVRAVDAAGNEDDNVSSLNAPTEGIIDFTKDIQPIFTANCTASTCHHGSISPPSPAADLNLTAGNAYAALVGVLASQCSTGETRVVVGVASSSYIINKLTGVGMCPDSMQMPRNATPLSDTNIGIIEAWINLGAIEF